MQEIVKVLEQKRCMQTTEPSFKLDPINLILDKEGRVFYNGAQPYPYKVRMDWCGYTVNGEGSLNVVAALQEPPTWGFRFRPKAYIGVLLAEPFYPKEGESWQLEDVSFDDVFDAGVMVDFFFVEFFNLNVAVGFQSFGAGVGFDLTKNFGAYIGYALTWGDWHHNPNVGFWFGF